MFAEGQSELMVMGLLPLKELLDSSSGGLIVQHLATLVFHNLPGAMFMEFRVPMTVSILCNIHRAWRWMFVVVALPCGG